MKLGGHAPEELSYENGAPRKGCTRGFGQEDDCGHAPSPKLRRSIVLTKDFISISKHHEPELLKRSVAGTTCKF